MDNDAAGISILITLILIVGLIIFIVKERKKENRFKQLMFMNRYNLSERGKISAGAKVESVENISYEYKNDYKRKKLLTENEKRYYNVLAPYAEKKNLQILSKIRLADLIEPKTNNTYKENILFSKIKAKHIDFALCNKNDLNPILLIEVDDKSHNIPERKERDKFIDNALRGAGYKIIHIQTPENLEKHLDYLT